MKSITKILGKSLYVNSLPHDLLRTDVSLGRTRDLFSQYVDLVEIENHSYCNRTCWFCPNVFLDRRSVNHVMKETVFEKIIGDLSSIGFKKTLVWSRYHEPLADESIYARISKARAELPNALLALTSNGDYLNTRTLKALECAGVDRLLLDLYLPDHNESDPAELAIALGKFLQRTGLTVTEHSHREYVVHGSTIKITMGAPIFSTESMSTRGGLMEIQKLHSFRRTAVCLAPIHHVVIDYNGKGMLCCQTRSDAAKHKDAIIGDLGQSDYSIFHLYRDLGSARKGLTAPGNKDGVCQSCDVSSDGPNILARQKIGVATLRALQIDGVIQRAVSSRKRRYE